MYSSSLSTFEHSNTVKQQQYSYSPQFIEHSGALYITDSSRVHFVEHDKGQCPCRVPKNPLLNVACCTVYGCFLSSNCALSLERQWTQTMERASFDEGSLARALHLNLTQSCLLIFISLKSTCASKSVSGEVCLSFSSC